MCLQNAMKTSKTSKKYNVNIEYKNLIYNSVH